MAAPAAMMAANIQPGSSGASAATRVPAAARATVWETEPARLAAAVCGPGRPRGQREQLRGQGRRSQAHATPGHAPQGQAGPQGDEPDGQQGGPESPAPMSAKPIRSRATGARSPARR